MCTGLDLVLLTVLAVSFFVYRILGLLLVVVVFLLGQGSKFAKKNTCACRKLG